MDGKDCAVPSSQAANILDFFDGVGLYHKKRIISTEMTWVVFYYWVGHYWQLLKNDAERFEELAGRIEYYKNVRALYKKLTRYGQRRVKLPSEQEYFTEDRLRTFLEEEIQQCSTPKTEAAYTQDKRV